MMGGRTMKKSRKDNWFWMKNDRAAAVLKSAPKSNPFHTERAALLFSFPNKETKNK